MELDKLNQEDTERFFQLYYSNCLHMGITPNMKDFTIWFNENYGG